MKLSFPKVVFVLVSVSAIFFFLAWRECGTLWIVGKETYEETKYDLEKEGIKMSARWPSYELAEVGMFAGLGFSIGAFFEVPPLPEVQRIPFIAYRVEGGIGRGASMGVSVDKLKTISVVGVNYGAKVGFVKRAFLSLEVKGDISSKSQEEVLKVSSYVVKPGDTLWDIAKRFGVTLDTIVSANDLGYVDMLKIGQVIKVPNVSGVFHKVARGETIEGIAKSYKVDVEQIKKYNPNLNGIKVGALVFIPGARLPERFSSPERPSSRPRWLASRRSSQRFIWPVEGRVASDFGWRRDPFSRRREFHPAIDIDTSSGAPIRASRSGKVTYAGWQSGYGLLVVIDHGDGWETWYAHCSRINVRLGQYVNQGDVIGRVGSTGRATGSHLHFEIRKDGRPVNPLYYLR